MKMKHLCSILLSVLLQLTGILPCFAATPGFEYLSYPPEAFTVFDSAMLSRISSGDDCISNRGYNETGLYVSPFWTMTVNGKDVPVYATSTYDWATDIGVLQSYQYIFIDDGAQLDAVLTFTGNGIKNAVVLPSKLNVAPDVNGREVSVRISHTGSYTLLINDASQETAVTLFVRENTDENAEIEKLRAQYGESGVQVYEKGVYSVETLPTDADCIYFKRGSFVSFSHVRDIRKDEDAQGVALAPAMELNGKSCASVKGCGTFDFTKIDRFERNLICINFCENTLVEGLILLNPNSWTVTAYGCNDCEIRDITVFGYRTNSDGINICGCENMTVSGSFCRNGDDCFSVKATNTEYECHDIVFSDCIGWTNKARCFGITGEVERDIYNILFSDCSVIVRNAVWDLNRTGSLVIAAETGSGCVRDVTFENVEIFKDTGRPVYCMVYGDNMDNCRIENITFRDIRMNADNKIKISSQREISFFGKICAALNNTCLGNVKCLSDFFEHFYRAGNSVSVSFENVTLNGKILERTAPKSFEVFGNTQILFG